MAEEKKKSLLSDILKRERLEKAFRREQDKSKQIEKAKEAIQKKEEKSPSGGKELQNKVDTAKAEQIFDQAVSELTLDIRFYYLKEGEYCNRLRSLYIQHKNELDKYGLDVKKFLDYSRESFDRYKKVKNMMPLDPMKPKAYEYVEKSILELLDLFAKKFGK